VAVVLESGLPRVGTAMKKTKGAGDYVTATDHRSKAAILEVLARESPGVAVLAEECGTERADSRWAVDPYWCYRGSDLIALKAGRPPSCRALRIGCNQPGTERHFRRP
jgi:hypothetical protein